MSDYTNNIGIKINVTGATSSAKAIDKVSQALNKLNSVSSSSNGFANNVNGISQALNSNSKEANNNTKSLTALESAYRKIRNIAFVVTAIKAVTKVIDTCVSASMKYTENLNLFTTIMGKYADEAMNYAQKVNDVVGIDTSEWIYNEGIFMSLAKGFGIAGEQASFMSEQLTQLGYDIASFYNIDTETAMLKLKSGFSGELEPLRNIGYDLSQAKLKEIARSLNISKSFTDMTQAEKAQLRYIAIMTQLTEVQGDMAKTLQSPANQLRLLQTAFTKLARSIGNVFIPVVQKLLPILTYITNAIREVVDEIAVMVGFVETTFSSETEGVSALTDDLDEATESAKKLKNQLAGFDEISNLSTSTSSSSSSSTEFTLDLSDYYYDFLGKLQNSELSKNLEGIKKFIGNIGDSIKYLISFFGDLLRTNGDDIKDLIDNILKPIKILIELMQPNIKEILENLKTSVNYSMPLLTKIGEALASFGKGIIVFFQTILYPIKDAIIEMKIGLTLVWYIIREKLIKVFDDIATFFDKGTKALTEIYNKLASIFGWKQIGTNGGGNTTTYTSLGLNKTSPIAVTKLATGGVVNNPTLAMVGEDGKEAVVPLENNTGWMNALASQVGDNSNTALLERIIDKIDGIDLQPTISVQDVGEASIHYINKKQRLLGGSVI